MRGLSLRDWLERLRTIFDFVGENVRVCMIMVQYDRGWCHRLFLFLFLFLFLL